MWARPCSGSGAERWSPLFHFALHLHVASCSAFSGPAVTSSTFCFHSCRMLKTTPCHFFTHPPSTFKASYKKTKDICYIIKARVCRRAKRHNTTSFLAPRSRSVEGFSSGVVTVQLLQVSVCTQPRPGATHSLTHTHVDTQALYRHGAN